MPLDDDTLCPLWTFGSSTQPKYSAQGWIQVKRLGEWLGYSRYTQIFILQTMHPCTKSPFTYGLLSPGRQTPEMAILRKGHSKGPGDAASSSEEARGITSQLQPRFQAFTARALCAAASSSAVGPPVGVVPELLSSWSASLVLAPLLKRPKIRFQDFETTPDTFSRLYSSSTPPKTCAKTTAGTKMLHSTVILLVYSS